MAYVPGNRIAAEQAVVHAPMSFRAIVAGWLVASGVAGLLYVAGLALGFSSFNAWHAEASAKGIGIGSAIWMIVTWVVALLLGGLFASWYDGRDDQTSGALHGVTVWGLSVTATGLWLALGLANAMHGHPSGDMRGPGDRGGMHAGMMATDDGEAIAVLDANVASLLGEHNRTGAAPIVAALVAGHDVTASSLLAADNGSSLGDATHALQRLAPEISNARVAAKTAADRAAHYTAMTLWIAFISSFLALLAAAIGGWLGAGHIHRVYHLRTYPSRTLS